MSNARLAALSGVVLLLAALGSWQPVFAQQPGTAAVASQVRVVAGTGGNGLGLRPTAGTDGAMVQVLPEGTIVQVLDGPVMTATGDWYHVQAQVAGAPTGYCSGAYLAPQQSQPSATDVSTGRVVTAKVTGYGSGAGGGVGIMTASGTRAHWGTVAADTRLYPFGTRLLIEGFEGTVFVVEDTGGAVHGDIFDVYFPDLSAAIAYGTQSRRVTVHS